MLRTITKPEPRQKLNIDYKLTIRAPRPQVFKALTVGEIIDEWGGGPARVQAKVHGNIILWDGEMSGSIRELQRPSLLVHTLRHARWEPNCMDSLVVWKLKDLSHATLLSMHHTDLPNRKLWEAQNELWAAAFLGPLKAYLET